MEDADRIDIAASINGDDDAYARLVRRCEAPITALMWRFSRDPAVCEELVQEVFVEAYFSLKSYRGDAPFLNWLRTIATRVGYRFWRGREKRHLPLQDADAATAPGDAPDRAEAGRIVHALLARLGRAERLVLTLMYFDGCSTRDIARRMGWSRAMVKMRAYRARKKLKLIAQREGLLEDVKWIR
jgi:RNA polymerase sigma-70 factor (ECF subfamily)